MYLITSLLCLVIVVSSLGVIVCDETDKTDSSISTRSIDSGSDDKPLRINLSCKLFIIAEFHENLYFYSC